MNGCGDGSNEDDDDGDDVDWSGRELPIDSGSWQTEIQTVLPFFVTVISIHSIKMFI